MTRNAMFEALHVALGSPVVQERAAMRKGELDAEAWAIVEELAGDPSRAVLNGLIHRAAKLLHDADPQAEGFACPVHCCESCAEEVAEERAA